MVELKLDTSDAHLFSKDHYISVRVGEVQKLAKLTNSRTYKFPAAAVAARKYGRVEIFRRVGTAIVCVDPEIAVGANDVEVTLDGNEDTKISFKSEVNQGGGSRPAAASPAKAPPSPTAASDRAASVSQKAASYLEQHHLEVRLSDAMQAVLRERPEDPAAFLANVLLKNSDLVAKLPKAHHAPEPASAPASPKQADPAPALPPAQRVEPEVAAKSAPPPPQAQAAPAAAAPKPAKVEAAAPAAEPSTPRPAQVVPFAGYYASNFTAGLGKESSGLLSKFPPAPRPEFRAAAEESKAVAATMPASAGFLPSMATGGCTGQFGGMVSFASRGGSLGSPEEPAKSAAPPAPKVEAAIAISSAAPAMPSEEATVELPFPASDFMLSNVAAIGPGFWDTGLSPGFMF